MPIVDDIAGLRRLLAQSRTIAVVWNSQRVRCRPLTGTRR